MINKKLGWVGILLVTAFLIAACGGGAQPAGEDGAQAPQATAAASDSGGNEQPASTVDLKLDPANLSGENAENVAAYLYEGLAREQDGAVVGALAENITVSEDGLDYIFTLRQGVTFHDGSELNADVVMANFNRWFDPNDPNRSGGDYAAWVASFNGFKGEVKEEGKPKSQVDGIEKVDGNTIIIHLNTPDPDFLKKMSNVAFAIVNPQTLSGSGPYRPAALNGSTLTLEPFPGYWDAASIPSASMDVPAP